MVISKQDLKTGDIGYGLRDVLERHYGVGAITDESIDELIEYLEGESEENHSRHGRACYMIFGDKEIVHGLNDLMCVKYDVKCRLGKKEAQLKTQKDLLNIDKQDLLLNTDFKSKGITNQAGRNAYVDKNSAIMERKEKIEKKQADVDKLRMDYEWACDELENYRLLIKLEISRRGLESVEGE